MSLGGNKLTSWCKALYLMNSLSQLSLFYFDIINWLTNLSSIVIHFSPEPSKGYCLFKQKGLWIGWFGLSLLKKQVTGWPPGHWRLDQGLGHSGDGECMMRSPRTHAVYSLYLKAEIHFTLSIFCSLHSCKTRGYKKAPEHHIGSREERNHIWIYVWVLYLRNLKWNYNSKLYY